MSVPFKFNFSADAEIRNNTEDREKLEDKGCENKIMNNTGQVEILEDTVCQSKKRTGKEITVHQSHFDMTEHCCMEGKFATSTYTSETEDQSKLLYYIPAAITSDLSTQHCSILQKINDKSTDLIPGEYEGGFKIWECSRDLIGYLCEIKITFTKTTKILELGCGAGLPGIYCLSQGATVHFQDYNEEVINMTTIPNAIINAKFDSSIKMDSCQFYAGDWNLIETLLSSYEDDKYDYILASETIYNPNNYEAFHSLLKSSLKPTGTVYIAAKVCYFGIGGSSELFKCFVKSKSYFEVTPCKTYEDGVKREIFKLTVL